MAALGDLLFILSYKGKSGDGDFLFRGLMRFVLCGGNGPHGQYKGQRAEQQADGKPFEAVLSSVGG